MGLSLNNIYQRPYVNQDARSNVKRKAQDEQTASANAQREESANPNAKSKGLQYTEQNKPAYTPNYAQSFAASAYSNVNINSQKTRKCRHRILCSKSHREITQILIMPK